MKKTTPNLTEQYATSYRGIVKRKGKIIYMSHHCNIFIKAADRANLYAARHGGTAYVRTSLFPRVGGPKPPYRGNSANVRR